MASWCPSIDSSPVLVTVEWSTVVHSEYLVPFAISFAATPWLDSLNGKDAMVTCCNIIVFKIVKERIAPAASWPLQRSEGMLLSLETLVLVLYEHLFSKYDDTSVVIVGIGRCVNAHAAHSSQSCLKYQILGFSMALPVR